MLMMHILQIRSIQQDKWLLVYPYLMHNEEDGSIATDGTGNSYDINNYRLFGWS